MSSAQSNRTKRLEILSLHPLFAPLPVAAIGDLAAYLIISRHEPGSILFRQGEDAREVFLVFDGRIKLTSITMHARTALLRVAGPGDVVGLAQALCNHEHLATAEVTTSSLLAGLHCDDLMNAIDKYPELSRVIVQYLAKEAVRAARETLSLRVPCSSSQRLAAALLHLLNAHASEFRSNGTLLYTHAELAQLIGASRETVTRLMKRFEEKAMIASKKSALTIIDPKQLERTAEFGEQAVNTDSSPEA